MVMESPSPQCVGREFVRQYYTLMNEAPKFLHRFYSANSSFIHSGVDRPGQEATAVFGQTDIHKKIQELNFVDCHTKIRQVDSQATIGDGVVVQVTGELSNRGGPMRRFMQTFVLAHQTPKQYYVNNDIFRYQDEVFSDSYESEEDQESNAQRPVVENGVTSEMVPNGVSHQTEELSTPVATVIPERTPTPPQAEPAETETMPVEPTDAVVPDETPELAVPEPAEPEQPPKVEEERPVEVEPVAAPVVETKPPVVEKPKIHSWANVAAGGGSSTVAVVTPMSSAPAAPSKQTALPLATITAQQKEAEENVAAVAAVAAQSAQDEGFTTQQPKNNRGDGGSRPPRHEFPGDRERDRRTNEKYPDTHQVFVGNLPVDIADLELKRFFNDYGKVMDVRVNRGPTGKVPFGFVVFDSQEPVTELLKLKRVEMNGHRLNVEEKKARNDRAGSNSRAPRNQRPQQRAGSRPKDRENSGSRSDKRPAQHGNRNFGGRQ